MNRFVFSVDLQGKPVWLIGTGGQIREKAEKLPPFGAKLLFLDAFPEGETEAPAMVIVGDTPWEEAQAISLRCRRLGIPVNVVDQPELCSFYFPALITRGDLTISLSTSGSSPAAAAYLRGKIEALLPEHTGEILQWLAEHRAALRETGRMKAAVAAAFAAGRPLTEAELAALE